MFVPVLIALAPVVLLIALGAALRGAGFLTDAFWPQAEKLAYYVLLPALFVHGLATADLTGAPVGQMAGALIAATLIAAAGLAMLRPALGLDGAAFTSVFQGGVRFNNYVGVALAVGLFGAQGAALAAVANAAIVPTVNILCMLVFAWCGGAGGGGAGRQATAVLGALARNPLILACAAGLALRWLGLAPPAGVEGALRSLGAAAAPLGLLCVGAALRPVAARGAGRAMAAAAAVKFALLPAITLAVCLAAGLTGPAAVTALMFQALPTASSAYIFARQMGGDAPLMAAIIAMQTVMAAVTTPAAVALAAPFLGMG
jgi:malonate transporter